MSNTLTLPTTESPASNRSRGYHSVTPYLMLRQASKAIDFYKEAFGARERMRMPGPNGRIMHAELAIGDSVIMLAEEMPEMNFKGPESVGGSTVALLLYADDVDATFAQAIEAGAKQVRAVQNQFYGDRAGTLIDPFGHIWTIATHVEDVPTEELQRRMAAMGCGCGESHS